MVGALKGEGEVKAGPLRKITVIEARKKESEKRMITKLEGGGDGP